MIFEMSGIPRFNFLSLSLSLCGPFPLIAARMRSCFSAVLRDECLQEHGKFLRIPGHVWYISSKIVSGHNESFTKHFLIMRADKITY